jgi:hypothetical protein
VATKTTKRILAYKNNIEGQNLTKKKGLNHNHWVENIVELKTGEITAGGGFGARN